MPFRKQVNSTLLLVAFILLGFESISQELVSNIAPSFHSSEISLMLEFNGKLLFIADNSVQGRELYISDGTAAGTIQLTDFFKERVTFSFKDNGFFVVDDKCLFIAKDIDPDLTSFSNGLWVTDGTKQGTVLIDENVSSLKSPFFKLENYVITIDGKNLLRYDTLSFNKEIIEIQGTPPLITGFSPMTVIERTLYLDGFAFELVQKVVTYENRAFTTYGSDGIFSMDANGQLTFLNKTNPSIYFPNSYRVAEKIILEPSTSINNNEPYVFDLQTKEMSLLKDVNPFFDFSSKSNFFAPIVGTNPSKLFFAANNEDYGREMWVTDGTEIGTKLLIDIRTGFNSNMSATNTTTPYLYNNNGGFYFEDLFQKTWYTEGDSSNTFLIDRLDIGGRNYFFDDENRLDYFNQNKKLYSFNGDTLILLKDLQANGCSSDDFSIQLKVGNTLFFNYQGCSQIGDELYKLNTEDLIGLTGTEKNVSPKAKEISINWISPNDVEVIGQKVKQFSIYSIDGKLLHSSGLANTNIFSIPSLPQGLFILSVLTTGNQIFSTKIIR